MSQPAMSKADGRAVPEQSESQTTRAYRRRLGSYEITALSDGFIDLLHEWWAPTKPEDIKAALAARFQPTEFMRNGITPFLIHTGSELILIDSGAALTFSPNSFNFPDNLKDAGVEPRHIRRCWLAMRTPTTSGL